MAKYGKKTQKKMKKVMGEFKKGELKSGKSKKKVKSRKQAIAIGLSQARKAGYKAPKAKTASKKTTKRSTKTKSARSKKR